MRLLRYLMFILGIGIAIAVLSGCEAPTSFTVNSTDDQVDAVPGDGVCETADEDECTLRAAVQEANATPGPNVIELQPGATYAIARFGANEDAAATGDLDVTDVLTIHGNGATLDAERRDRAFDNHATLAIHELTIVDGSPIEGRAVRSAGDVSLVSTTVTQNGWNDEGPPGVYNIVNGGGKLVVADSAIHHNAGSGIHITSGDAAVVNTLIGYNLDLPGAVNINNDGGLLTVLNTSILDSTELVTLPLCTLSCVPVEVFLRGDGIRVGGSSRLRLVSSTISDHDFGILASAGATVEVAGSVIEHGRCSRVATSLGYNAGDDGSCFDGSVATDQGNLGPFASFFDLDSPPQTLVPALESPLLDAIPVGTPGLCDGSPGVDQRGLPRPADAGCDIGAIERQPTD